MCLYANAIGGLVSCKPQYAVTERHGNELGRSQRSRVICPADSASLVGWHANTAHLESWWTLVGTEASDPGYNTFAGDSHWVRNQSLLNAAQRFGNWAAYQFAGGPNNLAAAANGATANMPMDAPLAKQLLLATRLLLVALFAWPVWTTARRQDRLGQAATFGLACAALVAARLRSADITSCCCCPPCCWCRRGCTKRANPG